MSIDSAFSPVRFPALKNPSHAGEETRARASGHAAGYSAGLQAAGADVAEHKAQLQAEHDEAIRAGAERVDNAVALLIAAVDALNRRTVPLLAEAQDAIAATAIDLAEAIIGRELDNTDASATAALHRALAHVDPAIVHAVRMNPDDLAALDGAALAATGVTFVADASLSRGDAITEFPNGYLDARIGTALERARAVILEEPL